MSLPIPSRRDAVSRFTDEWASLLTGVEVWNRKYDGWAPSRAALQIASAYPHLRTFAGNDFHTRRQFFPLKLELNVTARSAQGVYVALATGRYRPFAFGHDLALLTKGVALAAAEQLERARARVATPVRAVRRRRLARRR